MPKMKTEKKKKEKRKKGLISQYQPATSKELLAEESTAHQAQWKTFSQANAAKELNKTIMMIIK